MAAAAGPDIVEDGLVLCLDAANERSYPGSGTTWFDLSGNNHSAELNRVDYSSENYFTLIRSEGDRIPINGYFYNSARLPQISIECFFKPFNTNVDTILASFDRNEYWRIGWGENQSNAPKLGFSFKDDSGQIDGFQTDDDLIENEWNHCIVTYNSGSTKIYLNNKLSASINTGGSQLGTGGVRYGYIGTGSEAEGFDSANGPTDYFDGSVSVFKIYETELTESDVKQNFQALRGRYGI